MIDGASLAQLRQGLYRFFGGALIAPDEERIAGLTAAADLLTTMGISSFAYHGRWVSCVEALGRVAGVDDLRRDYVRLFGSGVDASFCPPTESYYRAHAKGGGFATLLGALEDEYRRLGLTSVGSGDAPDHVATELEVMSALCAREVSARRDGHPAAVSAALSEQHGFLRRHLADWLPAFRDRVRLSTSSRGFYRELVEAAHAVVVHEVDLISAMRHDLMSLP